MTSVIGNLKLSLKSFFFYIVIMVLLSHVTSLNTVFPKPKTQLSSNTVNTIDTYNFQFISTGKQSRVVNEAITRYTAIIFRNNMNTHYLFRNTKAADSVFTACHIEVSTDNLDLSFATDESYTLDTTTTPTIKITANSAFGAVRALETLAQLIDRGTYVTATKIEDEPRFHYRGFMIDTARHFYPLNVIFQHLDAMAYSKFNVLHWHITDDQSFPYQSEVFPEMSRQGAFSGAHVYTISDIQRIVDYAFLRGIRVIPEFDTPGHVQRGFEVLQPPILTDCYNSNGVKYKTGPLNPTLNETYEFLDKLYDEVHSVFPDAFVHVGGDEVIKSCWRSNPQITAWMAEHTDIKTYEDLEQYFVRNLLNILKEKGISYMVWQEIFDNGAKILPDTVVEVWKDEQWQTDIAAVNEKGFHSVLASPYYINYIKYGADWKIYYDVEPTDFPGGPEAEASGSLYGIETCMWSEYVDATNFIPRSWPRATSIGERGWSTKDTRDLKDAEERLHEFRCKMLARGIPMEPIENGANMTALNGKNFCHDEWNPRYAPIWI